MIKKILRKIYYYFGHYLSKIPTQQSKHMLNMIGYYRDGVHKAIVFDMDKFSADVQKYVCNMRVGSNWDFKFSHHSQQPTLYSTVYACMIYSILGKLDKIPPHEKALWADRINSYQNKNDGLYYDEHATNDNYHESDWWGAKHLVLHVIIALKALGSVPKYSFTYLEPFYDTSEIDVLLNSVDWNTAIPHNNDIDNKIMNIGCMLQYCRDEFNDIRAKTSVEYLKKELIKRINEIHGMWGSYNIDNPKELSRMIQYYYHIISIFTYDKENVSHQEDINQFILRNQNILGGYGERMNSSACEDIDSAFILLQLDNLPDPSSKNISLTTSLPWVLANMNDDGGFVFRRDEALVYGCANLSSESNESNLFATWFRLLHIAYVYNHSKGVTKFNIIRVPGYTQGNLKN
jgi:prenyltransferase beta subunit